MISGHCFEVVSYVDLKNLSNTKSVLRARHLLKVKRSIGQSLNYNWLNGSIYVDKNLFLIVAPLFVLTSYPFILCSVYIATEKNLWPSIKQLQAAWAPKQICLQATGHFWFAIARTHNTQFLKDSLNAMKSHEMGHQILSLLNFQSRDERWSIYEL